MAEKQGKKPEKQKSELKEKAKPERKQEEDMNEVLVRIYGYDIPGSKKIYAGLTRIKGISWTISNAIRLKLGIPMTKRISELSKDEIKKIEDFMDNIDIPDFLKNRRNDRETGETSHLYGTDLDIKRDFDIKRLKKIKTWKGVRHAYGQPVRGQRTKSHFRKKTGSVSVMKRKEKKEAK